jgi:hypothetical protein
LNEKYLSLKDRQFVNELFYFSSKILAEEGPITDLRSRKED